MQQPNIYQTEWDRLKLILIEYIFFKCQSNQGNYLFTQNEHVFTASYEAD